MAPRQASNVVRDRILMTLIGALAGYAAYYLIEILPDAEVVRLKGVGHALHHTQTERIAHLISDFSRKVQSLTSGADGP